MYDSSMVTTDRHFTRNHSLDPSRPALLLIDVQPRRAEARMNCPHWLLALAIPFSRSDRAHTTTADVGAGCSEGLFRTDCSAGESPSVPAGRPWGVIPTGGLLYQARVGPSTHSRHANAIFLSSPTPVRCFGQYRAAGTMARIRPRQA